MNWEFVCDLEDIPARGARTVIAGKMEIGLFRISNGTVRAVENRCPHKQGPLAEGIVSGELVICPLHGWKINMPDGQVQPPDAGCVKVFATRIEDGKVFLQA